MARVIGGSTIGEGCFLDRDVVIGYPPGDELPLLDSDREAEIAGAAVGDNCTLRAGTLYSRARLGSSVRSGHGWLVREDSTVGNGCLIGTGVTIDNDCRVGDHCSLQTGVYIPTGSRIGDRCFLGPNATLTNDRTPLRTDYRLEGVTLGDDVTVGANATLMPGISVGEGAFIAGGAVVTRDVPVWKMAVGVPARIVDLPENLKKPNRLGK
ncbi:MAG: N-acetyltransferase [Methanobacteriota archaeon]|uniref:N-acetyltransferase n=1 Tax=Marine Group III euryarchaeote TaxID=2173149 RepID=A0A7C7ZDU6_9ARCH|nr:MAG: N-acetyltransferase [Euryarchaeota archaeon]HIG63739.1 N-acetyltransferase [Marine Group III euryarchaeote]HIL33216.1 N-acetyltransferase [Candidatus Poseidoniales archaeon]